MKYKTNKLKRLENKRYSILTEDMEHCIMCNQKCDDINEIFLGRNRINSIKTGLCIPLCRRCHTIYHNNRELQLFWMKQGLEEFTKEHTIEEFQNIFKYIKGLDIF